jgi:hypothetical protein
VIPATVYPSHPHLLHPHHQETTVTTVRDPFPSPLPHKRSLRVALVLTAALALAVVASGCGDDNEASAAQPGSGHHADDPPTIEVKATDFAFLLPDEVEAGTQLVLVNDAPTELHELVAIRLPDDEGRSAAELMKLPPEEMDALLGAGPPAAVLIAAPGADQIVALGDGTLTEPGRYLLICAIPTGADAQEFLAAMEANPGEKPEVGDGPPHFVHGMFGEVIVTGG